MPKYKRQRMNYEYKDKENFLFFDQPQHIAQVPFGTNFNQNNFISSPTQELGHIDELFNWLDEENSKPTNAYSPVHDVYGMNHIPDFGFLAPTMTEIDFF